MKEKLIAWFQKETDKPYIPYVLAAVAFFESIIFPIPVDVFTIALASAHPEKWFHYGLIATTWSVIGALAGYFLGAHLFEAFGSQMINMYGYQDAYAQVVELFQQDAFLVIFTSAFTPIPYKVFTLTAGALGIHLLPFIIASVLGRGIRFFAETWIMYRFRTKEASSMQKYFNWGTLIFAVLAVAYLLFRWL